MMQKLDDALMKSSSLEDGLKESVEEQLLRVRDANPDVLASVNPQGFVLYKLGDPEFVLLTLHDGTQVPNGVELKQDKKTRMSDDDLYTGELYFPLFLNNGGYWLTTHLSRFYVDLNRDIQKAIGDIESGSFIDAKDTYHSFYNQFNKLLSGSPGGPFLFNGHSMHDAPDRSDFCLIEPDISQAQETVGVLEANGLSDIRINYPFYGQNSYAMNCARPFIDFGSLNFETNKALYMDELNFKKLPEFDDISSRICNGIQAWIDECIYIL